MVFQNQYPYSEVKGKEVYPKNENDYVVEFRVFFSVPNIIFLKD